MKIKFFVPGVPAPGGSKKAFVDPRTKKVIVKDDAKNNGPWRERVALAGQQAYRGPLLDEPLGVVMIFTVTRPKGHYGASGKLKSTARRFPTTKPDVLKLARSTEDALTGVVWLDDSGTVDLTAVKRYGDRPGVEIEIRTM